MNTQSKEFKIVISLIIVLLMVISIFPIAKITSSVETHQERINEIDNKIQTVLKLTAASTVASAGITAIPGDTATPIAEKLADFSEYFLVILCILYSEKYLLTILGLGVFRLLVPISLAGIGLSFFFKPEVFRKIGTKILVFSLVLYAAIPLSLKVSDMIYATYQEQIDNTIESAEVLSDETAVISESAEDESMLAKVLDKLSETATEITQKAANLLKKYVDTLAVLIVTSCVIPILVVIIIIWVSKVLIGTETIALIVPPKKPKRG